MKVLKKLTLIFTAILGILNLLTKLSEETKTISYISNVDSNLLNHPDPPIELTSSNNTITFELCLEPNYLKDSGQFHFAPVEYIQKSEWKSEWKRPKNGNVNWSIKSDKPIFLNISDLLVDQINGFWLAEPGDRVVMTLQNSRVMFLGNGADKFILQYRLDSLQNSLSKPPNPRDYKTNSIEDYLEWNNYLAQKVNLAIPLINTYRHRISNYAFELINDRFIRETMSNLCSKFGSLHTFMQDKNIPMQAIIDIYDSVYSPTMENWNSLLLKNESIYIPAMEYKIYRQYSFDREKIPSKRQMTLLLCKKALDTYTGSKREQYILNHFPEQLMIEVGFVPEIESILDQYYSEPGYPEHKKWMKEQEYLIREKQICGKAPEFTLFDTKGRKYTKEQLKGKFAVMNFWVTGSQECERLATVLKKLENKFKNDTNVIFVNICLDTDKDRWLNSISEGKYTISKGIHIYTGEDGSNNPMIRKYAVRKQSMIRVMAPEGRIIRVASDFSANKDDGRELRELLLKHLAYPKDGPYVFDEDSTLIAWNVNGMQLNKTEIMKNKDKRLSVQTDIDKIFTVTLKESHNIEPSIYKMPDKLLALSDIEGNFDAFRKLLQANLVIDENFEWIFGDGHLVFAGDMFDRGLQVTECLWLIYSLEEKAEKAGGYVHFILGNHEIMNMQGDHRYVQTKYKNNSILLNKTLSQLYDEHSELGKWLRSKNIMEKIGNLLFVHGGISHQVWRMPLTISEMNHLARPYYSNALDSSNVYLLSLFGNRRVGQERSYSSPFWFRGYYGDSDNPYEIPSSNQLDSTLQKFEVERVITGHTIITDTISVHYNGRVINIDTKHAEGESEALLIIKSNYFRVNTEGKRKKLFN